MISAYLIEGVDVAQKDVQVLDANTDATVVAQSHFLVRWPWIAKTKHIAT